MDVPLRKEIVEVKREGLDKQNDNTTINTGSNNNY
jgi:hypothetical protein